MNQDQLFRDILNQVDETCNKLETLAIFSGDPDFKLLSLGLKTLTIGCAKGDIEEMMHALAAIIETKNSKTFNATKDVLEDPRFLPSVN